MSWYAKKSAGRGQGLVISEGDGRNVAVVYDVKDTPLLAAAPALLAALERFVDASDRLWLLRGSAEQGRAAIAKAKEGVS